MDHFSRFVYVTIHETKEATESVKSKQEFQDYAARFGVKLKNIRADNGVYAAKLFQDFCAKNQHHLTFFAVGAHWQNGIAEHFIGTIQSMANTILLHGMAYWPGTVTKDMWPFAVRHAVNFHNSSIRRNRQASPYWPRCSLEINFWMSSLCLNKKLQDGDSVKKW